MKYYLYLLYVGLLTCHLYPSFGAIDKIGFQWLLISIIALLFFLVAFINKDFIKIFSNQINSYKLLYFSFLGFVLISFLSTLFSYNQYESLITSQRYLLILFILSFFHFFFNRLELKKRVFINTIIILLFVEVIVSFILIFVDLKQDNFSLRKPIYAGFASNVNILSSLILPKIPILLYKFLSSKSLTIKGFCLGLFTLSSFVLFSLGSRITFLILMLFFIVFLATIFCEKTLKERIKASLVLTFLVFVSCINFSIINGINNRDGGILTKRLESTVDLSGESSGSRLRYYKLSLDLFKKNPILGIGSGQWKLYSIDLDKQNIRNYIIPYHSHNDFLQILAELGLIGLIAYLTILFYPLKIVMLQVFKGSKYHLFILMSVIAFLMDSLINFPIARPVNQILLMLFISFLISQKPESKEV